MKVFDGLDFEVINSSNFKEDSVREEIIAPLLKALGYSAFGENQIIRSKSLMHPYIYFGTKKENITIIPDYLIQIKGENKFIIDAKSPKEEIMSGKNVEQAYSYAIHREINVNIFMLCNGIELVIFDTNHLNPIYQVLVSEIEEKWDELYRLLSPIAFMKPFLFNYRPDFGIRLLRMDWPMESTLYFLGAWVNQLAKLNDDYYTFTSGIPFETICLASFDFHKSLFDDFVLQIPEDKKQKVLTSISNYPFVFECTTEEESFEVYFESMLGDKVIENENEVYCPLIITKFITKTVGR